MAKVKQPHTWAFKLFHYPFQCMVQNMHIFSETQQREVGVFSTGTVEGDERWANRLSPYMTTIAKLAEIFEDDGAFEFINPSDSLRAYNIIHGHLSDCVERARTRINGKAPPIDDLKVLDRLAAEIYRSAKVEMAVNYETPELIKKLEMMSPFANPRKEKLNKVADKHDPITQLIIGQDVEDMNKWRR